MSIVCFDRLSDSCRLSIPNRRFEFQCRQDRILIHGNDIRIEQLLDKLIDNAVEFSLENSEIRIQLEVNADAVKLSLANEGQCLPEDLNDQLFESMTSYRSSDQRGQSTHLGIGLFVVRLIVEYHGGQAITEDLPDKNGVVVTLTFPLP